MDLQDYTEDLLDIVEKMGGPNPSFRPSADEILRFNYFK